MKTKVRGLFVLLVCVLCLSGCVRYDANVKIKKNGKADVAVTVAMSSALSMDEYADYFDDEYDDEFSLSSGFTDEQIEEFEDQGFEVEKYRKDGYNGYTISKKDVDIEEFDGNDDLFDKKFTIEKDGDIYTIDWKVFDADEEEEMLMMSSYMIASGGYMKFTIELPNKPMEHNATEVSDDGKTLTWDLLSLDDDQTVYVKYRAGGSGALVPIIIAISVLLVLAIIVVVIILVLHNRKKQQQQMYGYDPYTQYYAQLGLQGEREVFQQNQQNQYQQQNQFQQNQQNQFNQNQFGLQNQFQQPQNQQFNQNQQFYQNQFQQPQNQQFNQNQFGGQQNMNNQQNANIQQNANNQQNANGQQNNSPIQWQ
ncbi:LppM family (lipo)protein [Butyrivibrio proteoclasticus]|uniref:LppM family (lipo)protein n=1 Tax=Butyrivibrio proteoclasticus TaxID=43305 RepID=UPI000AAE3C92|nr:DUF3153 domain-containing protein [Butyrivibrio proteoclasticus]